MRAEIGEWHLGKKRQEKRPWRVAIGCLIAWQVGPKSISHLVPSSQTNGQRHVIFATSAESAVASHARTPDQHRRPGKLPDWASRGEARRVDTTRASASQRLPKGEFLMQEGRGSLLQGESDRARL